MHASGAITPPSARQPACNMPTQTRYLLHQNGPALWPEHKPLREVLELQQTTPANIWQSTYQGNPTAPEGTIFQRAWFRDRFDLGDVGLMTQVVARWVSWDTALKDDVDNAYTAAVVGELTADYRLLVRRVWRARLQFPELPDTIVTHARRANDDDRLRGVLIEDKASGTSAYQTLTATAEDWLKPLLIPFMPSGDKEQRANQAAVWCRNGCVLLPAPAIEAPWLIDFEDELFTFPGSAFKDQVDAFAQLVLYAENLLAEGLRARTHSEVITP